jgi:hypothetical protein
MSLVRAIARVGFVGAVMALTGCAQDPDAYETAVAEITARHRDAVARVAREAERERQDADVEAKRRQHEDRAIAKMREPLAKFLAEAPKSCGSQHLLNAADGWPTLLAQTPRSGGESDAAFRRRVGATMLDIANAMQQAGCPAAARQVYNDVLRVFVGSTYADLRLRAQFGVAYLTRNAGKWPPAPTQAASADQGARAMGH